jgi:3-oxoacid CoA-transferase
VSLAETRANCSSCFSREPETDSFYPNRYTTKAFGPLMAKAAKLTIVEAENIVEVGEIDPNDVHLPGIFVDRIVPSTAEKHIEVLKLRKEDGEKAGSTGSAKDLAQEKRDRIGRRAAEELRDGYYVNLGVGEY